MFPPSLSLLLFLFLPLLAGACPHHTRSSVHTTITKALSALGGEAALQNLTGVIYHVPSHYRSTSLMQSYSPYQADKFIATSGRQEVSFAFDAHRSVKMRIDRWHTIADEWIWSSPTLQPMEYTLVVTPSKACYTKGNNIVFFPREVVGGCVHPTLGKHMYSLAQLMSPSLILQISHSPAATVSENSIHDPTQNITFHLSPRTWLPHTIVSPTAVYRVYNYSATQGVMFPRHFLRLDPETEDVLEDFLVEDITVNPSYPGDFFSSGEGEGEGAAVGEEHSLTQTQLAVFSQNMLSITPYAGRLENMTVTQPLGVKGVYYLAFNDAPGYKQVVVEFEGDDGMVMVADAPPGQSLLVIEWVKRELGKNLTHCWITHHHGDHALGATDFVEAGAKLIIPEVARSFWKRTLPEAELVMISDEKPFRHLDGSVQLTIHWSPNAVHAQDWTYAHITSSFTHNNSSLHGHSNSSSPSRGDKEETVFLADVWFPGQGSDEGVDIAAARQWLLQARRDGVGAEALVLPAHGNPTPLRTLVELTGFD
ncbi:hypothetical protein BDD12DRAFT_498856 [Trichophaea hybrida]|nr:hypothetical protein BDD12DRAFT_498856 [Trichophaea hybrida]